MTRVLRALLLEDDAADAELIQRELRRTGMPCRTRVVDNRADFAVALRDTWDLILADYTLPAMNGEDAIAMVREESQAVPIVFVTGTIGEDHAVELLRSGATDYVLKDRLSRLGPVVQRALAEVEERRQRARLEVRVREAERLETLGRLAGGVAHDFNNILMAADCYAALALEELTADAPAAHLVVESQRSLARAAALTKQLLAIARRQPLTATALDPVIVVVELISMLEQLVGRDITILYRSGPETVLIEADRSELERVIVNLVLNARDAMPGGGMISINVGAVSVDENWGPDVDLSPGRYVVVEVSDNGTGMTDDAMAHIFEPFFTTKALGSGTGLGLSTSSGIVHQSGGAITVETLIGKGSKFRVYWPCHEGPMPAVPSATSRAPESLHGASRVLVVDTDDSVLRFVSLILGKHGYSVISAPSSDAALAVPVDTVDAVLTDLAMPGMDGLNLAPRLVEVRPALPIVFMTGSPPVAALPGGLERSIILMKPFSSEGLLVAVRAALGDPAVPDDSSTAGVPSHLSRRRPPNAPSSTPAAEVGGSQAGPHGDPRRPLQIAASEQ